MENKQRTKRSGGGYLAIVDALLGSLSDARSHLSDTICVGPCLWRALRSDPALRSLGTHLVMNFESGGRHFYHKARLLGCDTFERVLSADIFKAELQTIRGGTVRHPTPEEHNLYHRLGHMWTEGPEVTVVGKEGTRLLLRLGEKKKLYWLDVMAEEFVDPIEVSTLRDMLRASKEQ